MNNNASTAFPAIPITPGLAKLANNTNEAHAAAVELHVFLQ